MPTFISVVHNFKIKDDGLLTALPYLAMFLLQIPLSFIADMLNKRQCMSLTTSRKIWNSVSMWGASFGLILLGFLDESATATIVLYIGIVAIGCCSNFGYSINHMDLSPNFTGVLMGITNAIASSGGVFAPLGVGVIITNQVSLIKSAIKLSTCFRFFIITEINHSMAKCIFYWSWDIVFFKLNFRIAWYCRNTTMEYSTRRKK